MPRLGPMFAAAFDRSDALRRLDDDALRRGGGRRRHHRGRLRPRRRVAGPAHRAGRTRRLRVGHLVEVVEARARRPALPPAGRRPARLRGTRRTPAPAPQRPAPGEGAAVPDPRVLRRRRRSTGRLARAMGTAMWMYDLTGGLRIGKLHKRISAAEALEHLPTLPAERLAAVVPLLRRPRRRRPALPRGRPHRGAAFGAARERRRGDRPRQGRRRPGHGPSRSRPTADPIEVDRRRGDQRRRRVGRRRRAPLDEGAHVPDSSARPRASTSPCRGTRSRNDIAACIPVPERPAVGLRGAVGRLHLHRHDRHRLRRPARRSAVHRGRHRLPARGPERRHHHRGRPRPTSSAHGPACARWSPTPTPPAAPPTSPAATTCSARPRASSPSPAASSRPTGRWPPTPSTRSCTTCSTRGILERVRHRSRTKHLRLQGADGYDAVMATADELSPLGGCRRAPPRRPLRRRGPHGPRHGGVRPRAGRAAGAGAALPAGRGGLRGALRDGPHGRRRAQPPHPGPPARPGRLGPCRRRRRRADRPGARLGPTPSSDARPTPTGPSSPPSARPRTSPRSRSTTALGA